jgi:RimJ/RimL family protein N-acetyltransferase
VRTPSTASTANATGHSIFRKSARGGLGAAIEASFIDFAFDTLGIEKLNCEVIEGNDTVVKLHKRFLFCDEDKATSFL